MSVSDYQTQDELLGVPADFIRKNSTQHDRDGDVSLNCTECNQPPGFHSKTCKYWTSKHMTLDDSETLSRKIQQNADNPVLLKLVKEIDKQADDGDTPNKFFGGKSRNEVVKEIEECGRKMKEAEEIIFKCRCDRFEVMWDDWGHWTVFATCRDEFQAKMIQTALKEQGKTSRITAYKELSKMFDVVEGDKKG